MTLLVVTGGRDRHQDRDDALWLRAWFLALWADALAHGDCYHRCDDRTCRRRSIDRWAGVCGERLGLRVESYRARWDLHGNAAGTLRNLEMLDLGPTAVLAFPGSRGLWHNGRLTGTGHCVHHAKARGIPVMVRGEHQPPAWVDRPAAVR